MKETRWLWDMPITIEIIDTVVKLYHVDEVFKYFVHVDDIFNIYNPKSEISRINEGSILSSDWSKEMQEVLSLCEDTTNETHGYFNHHIHGHIDPLGIVKGWAIKKAADVLLEKGFKNFYINAGGDIQTHGCNKNSLPWSVGIRNPFNRDEHIKSLSLSNCGIATSGTYIRGNHIQNPFNFSEPITDIVSLTVIGPNVFEADRFATAAFAMGNKGIYFIETMQNLEGYMINNEGIVTYTHGFEKYITSERNPPPLHINV